MKYCHQCGHANEAHHQYCERDGVLLETTDTSYHFDVSKAQFCTSCGEARQSYDVYCHSCGQTALEPKIGVNRVEESLKSVAATGSQVMSQLRQVAQQRSVGKPWKQVPSSLSRLTFYPTEALQGVFFSLGFLIVIALFAAGVVSILSGEQLSSLGDELQGEVSFFNLTMLLAFLSGANVYWEITTAQINQFITSLGADLSELFQVDIAASIQIGNFFMTYGGVFLMLLVLYVLLRQASSWQHVVSRFVGFIGMTLVGYGVFYAFAFRVPMVEVAWLRTLGVTLLMLLFVAGLAYLLAAPLEREWKVVQQGVRALVATTLLSTILGIGYLLVQVNKFEDEQFLDFIDQGGTFVLVGQAASLNWQTMGHAGEQSLSMQSPFGSYALGMSLFGETAPNAIDSSVEQVSNQFGGVEEILYNALFEGDQPDIVLSEPRTITTVSPMILGTMSELGQAERAQDEARADELYQDGVFPWLLLLIGFNVLLYAWFAMRVVTSLQHGLWYVGAALIGFIIWQWFLQTGMFIEMNGSSILNVSTDGISFIGMLAALVLMAFGALLGCGANKKRII